MRGHCIAIVYRTFDGTEISSHYERVHPDDTQLTRYYDEEPDSYSDQYENQYERAYQRQQGSPRPYIAPRRHPGRYDENGIEILSYHRHPPPSPSRSRSHSRERVYQTGKYTSRDGTQTRTIYRVVEPAPDNRHRRDSRDDEYERRSYKSSRKKRSRRSKRENRDS